MWTLGSRVKKDYVKYHENASLVTEFNVTLGSPRGHSFHISMVYWPTMPKMRVLRSLYLNILIFWCVAA